jgi:DNA repair protein RecO (recombination protein O)
MKSIVEGILIKRINYSETSLIVKFYTQSDGLTSFLFQGGKKKKGNSLQPLGLFEITSYKRPESDFGKISAIQSYYTFQSIPFHPVKSGLAFFLAELVEKSLLSQGSDPRVFSFLESEIKWLDQHDQLANYPIWFLLRLSTFLGFNPQINGDTPRYFEMQEGELTSRQPEGHSFISDHSLIWIPQALNLEKEEFLQLKIPKQDRLKLTNHLLTYYAHHVEHFRKMNSWEVLQVLF